MAFLPRWVELYILKNGFPLGPDFVTYLALPFGIFSITLLLDPFCLRHSQWKLLDISIRLEPFLETPKWQSSLLCYCICSVYMATLFLASPVMRNSHL